MTGAVPYLFATEAQWSRCTRLGLAEAYDFGADAGEAVADVPGDAVALAAGPDGTPYWVGADGALRRDSCTGPILHGAKRLVVAAPTGLALGDALLLRFDPATLEMIAVANAADVDDVALSPAGETWRLRGGRIARDAPDGDRTAAAAAADWPAPTAIAFAGKTLAALAGDALLLWLDGTEAPPVRIGFDALGAPGFAADRIAGGSDGLLAWGRFGDADGFLIADAAGTLVARGRWPAPARLAGLGGGALLALFAGPPPVVHRYRGVGSGGFTLLTPALECDTLVADWLRADIVARLPEGATLSARWATSADETLPGTIAGLLAGTGRPLAARLADATALLDWQPASPVTYRGERREGPPVTDTLALPISEAAGHLLWIEISLHRNEAETVPRLERLTVLHDRDGLVEALPGVFRSPDGDADGTLARLVRVLEATTDGLDAEIDSLADRLDPGRTETRWLPELARLLGLPFDRALDPAMQRRLVAAAPALLTRRGTRAGLAALIEAIFPGRRVRIVDTAERLATLTLGSSALPAFLTGPSERVPRLNARLVLGRTGLCGASGDCRVRAPAPVVVVFVPTSGRERRRYGAAIERMLGEMVPAGVRLRVRWTCLQAGGARAADVLEVAEAPVPLRLGEGQALGRALVGGDRRPRLCEGGHQLEHRMW